MLISRLFKPSLMSSSSSLTTTSGKGFSGNHELQQLTVHHHDIITESFPIGDAFASSSCKYSYAFLRYILCTS